MSDRKDGHQESIVLEPTADRDSICMLNKVQRSGSQFLPCRRRQRIKPNEGALSVTRTIFSATHIVLEQALKYTTYLSIS